MLRILTDSSCEFTAKELEKLQIECIPLKLKIEGKEYLQNEITHNEFFNKLKNCSELPKTSQPSLLEFEQIFFDVKEKKDTMIAILIGSELSGTVSAAILAKNNVDYDNIYIIDSKTTIGALQILLYECCKLKDQHVSPEKIVAQIEKLKEKVTLYAIVDTLEYLKKGGRLSASSAWLGGFLRIKPVVTIDGKVKSIGKGIGLKSASEKIVELIKENPIDPNYPVIYGYSENKKSLEVLQEKLQDMIPVENTKLFSVGPVVGSHTGPGASTIIYVKKDKKKFK